MTALDTRPRFRYVGALKLAHVKDASRVTAVGGASAVPAGEGSSPLLSGGSGIMPAGTMTGTRGARCNRGRCWRSEARRFGCLPREAWPELSLGMRESLGREPWWNAERYAAPKRGQCRSPQGCGGYGTASYGVPLPFFFSSWPGSSEATKQSRAAGLRTRSKRPRIASLRSQ